MRQARISKQEKKPRDSLKVPLVEQPMKRRKRKNFTQEEIEYIIRKRNELIAVGIADSKIAERISRAIKRSKKSVISKIIKLTKSRKLPFNPNNYCWTDDIVDLLKQKRETLILQGYNDKKIAKELADEIGKTIAAVYTFILRSVGVGTLSENPNFVDKKGFSAAEIRLISNRRNFLLSEGKTDFSIATILSLEMKKSQVTIEKTLRKLVKDRKLPQNPNKRQGKKFTDDELKIIFQMRHRLIQEEMADRSIAKIIADSLMRSEGSVFAKIKQLVKDTKITENPHNRKNRKSGFFTTMTDDDLVKFAKSYTNKKGIIKRDFLKNIDSGLYEVLRMRNLIDLVFSEIEQSKDQQLRAGLAKAADAMEQFGDSG
jgi:hypothetical protein